ncbi:MAG: hypothetical protein B7Z72_12680, partial [Gemmatimonadetes bacterium 21-71-4]
MTDPGVTTRRISTEGADLLTLAGVNDVNLVELSRLFGVRVALRGEALAISGAEELVERAAPVGRRMIDVARQRLTLSADDVLRLSELEIEDAAADGAEPGLPATARIALPGVRRVVQAKTPGQAEYLAKIAEQDIVIGIGP